jgi:tetratricopeptide (TPR) repeat protein
VRGAAGTAAVLVALATTIPTASVALLESSREHASRGELQPAFDDASGAASVAPWAASPRLQQALILEEAGALALATEYAKQAIERESANWQNWLTLARIEAKRGRLRAASAAFGEAERRNPRSGLFDEPVTSLATDDPSSG